MAHSPGLGWANKCIWFNVHTHKHQFPDELKQDIQCLSYRSREIHNTTHDHVRRQLCTGRSGVISSHHDHGHDHHLLKSFVSGTARAQPSDQEHFQNGAHMQVLTITTRKYG